VPSPLLLIAETIAKIESPLNKLYGELNIALIGMEHLRVDTTVARLPSQYVVLST